MNFKFIVLSALLYNTWALDDYREARILKYDFDNTGTGPYHFEMETSDGISREEQGNLINENTEDEAMVIRGSYSYADQNGKVYTVRYMADGDGFHPEGDHIKVPPYVPWVKGQPHYHHHYNTGDSLLSEGVNKNLTKQYLPSTPSRPEPTREYIPTTSRPPVRPQLNLEAQNQLEFNLFPSSTPAPIIGSENSATTRAYIPTRRSVRQSRSNARRQIKDSVVELVSSRKEKDLPVEVY